MAKTKGDGISRIERSAMAHQLRDRGHSRRQIQEILGVSQSYVQALFADPDGSKEKRRKQKFRGTCVDCGGVTSPASPGKPILRCNACAHIQQRASRKWTPERIIHDIQEWNRIYGEPPKSQQWLTGTHGDGTRNSREWPHVVCVQREFGSWSNAIEAAGFERRVNYERTDEWKAKVTKWPKEAIIEKIQQWVAEHGSPPRGCDWHYQLDDWPTEASVRNRFGTWNEAIRAAGFRPQGRRYRSERALAEFEDRLLFGKNGSKAELPSFESRGEGKSLLDVVDDLQEGR